MPTEGKMGKPGVAAFNRQPPFSVHPTGDHTQPYVPLCIHKREDFVGRQVAYFTTVTWQNSLLGISVFHSKVPGPVNAISHPFHLPSRPL